MVNQLCDDGCCGGSGDWRRMGSGSEMIEFLIHRERMISIFMVKVNN